MRALVFSVVLLAAAAAQAEVGDKTQRCQGKLISFHEVHFKVGKCEFTEGLPDGSIVLRACDNDRGRARGCIVEIDANEHVISARVK